MSSSTETVPPEPDPTPGLPPGRAAALGVVIGALGLAVSHLLAAVLKTQQSPVLAVADRVIDLVPGPLVEAAIDALGTRDRPALIGLILVVCAVLFAVAGRLARQAWWRALLVFVPLGAIGTAAIWADSNVRWYHLAPIVAGLLVWIGGTWLLFRRAAVAAGGPARGRRGFLAGVALGGLASVAIAYAGNRVGRARRVAEDARRLLRLPITQGDPPQNSTLPGLGQWRTPTEEFYRIDTAITVPTIAPDEWTLRIHGMVDREIRLTYDQLVAHPIHQRWTTLNCVSNEVGGDLIGNAWWSGVLIADLLKAAGVREGADAVLQTSYDGWTCGTPLAALTDDRQAMIAVGMNGEPLPIEHGFPARTLVPGLYGFVSACKWVVDFEVTRFSEIEAFWTTKGWAEQAPVKIASRVDLPAEGDTVEAGQVRIGGSAWFQHTGIASVEYSLDGGAWTAATLGRVPNADTWVQWGALVDLAPGDHLLRVRATGKDGETQTSARTQPVPDGATGWHQVEFRCEEA